VGRVDLSGASAGAQAVVVAPAHDLFARRKIQTASGVHATAITKRTARLTYFGAGTTLGTIHGLFLS
jgi:hypothetical protein